LPNETSEAITHSPREETMEAWGIILIILGTFIQLLAAMLVLKIAGVFR
jgi:hypothetical protein